MRRALAEILKSLSPDDADVIAEALAGAGHDEAPSRRHRLAERDERIREAFAAFYGDMCDSGAAKAMESDLASYFARGWLRERDLSELPPGASAHRRTLHLIARLNCGKAIGARQLLNILDGFRGG